MTSVREAIRESNRLARMRAGNEVGDYVDIPSMPQVRAMQVPLVEAEAQAGIVRSAGLDVIDNAAGIQARNRACIESDVWHSLRELDNPEQKVFKTIEEMTGELDSTDIDYLADNLMILMDYASPTIDGLTDQELDELKKAFVTTDWSALTGKRWAALKLAISHLFPELLRAKSLGTISTDSATETKEKDESTSTASRS